MDTSTQQPGINLAPLKKIISDLSESIGCIEPKSVETPSALADAFRHLEALEAQLGAVAEYRPGLVGVQPEDTLSHLDEVLTVLAHVDWQDCGSNEEFACGMTALFKVMGEALDFEKQRVGSLRASSLGRACDNAKGAK